MKIYLASGYTVMNVKNREKEISEKLNPPYRRLISFFDLIRGNDIYSVITIKRRDSYYNP